MRDLKNNKNRKVRQNRPKKVKQPWDWKKILHRTLQIVVGVGSGVLIVSGSLLTAQVLLESGYFAVNDVRVENHSRVTESDILAASDIHPGDGIFDLDLHLIGRKIEENPWIAKAKVERAFPDQVIIRVVEREPQAIADLGYLYYVDAGGRIFKLLDSKDSLDYPVITGLDRENMLNHPDEIHEELRLSLHLMQALRGRQHFKLEDVSEIFVDPQQGLTLYTLVGGVPIRLGHADFDYKLRRLEQVYADLKPRLKALKYIDLNVRDRVIVKLDVKRNTGRG